VRFSHQHYDGCVLYNGMWSHVSLRGGWQQFGGVCCFQGVGTCLPNCNTPKIHNPYAPCEFYSIRIFSYIAQLRNASSDERILCHSCGVVSVKEVMFAVRLNVVFTFRCRNRFLVRSFCLNTINVESVTAVQKFLICLYCCTVRCHCMEGEFFPGTELCIILFG